jgi:hypothetical protein
VGSEVYFFVFYTDFGSDIVLVELYSFWGQIQHFGDFFGGFALTDEIGDLDLGGRQLHKRI